MTHSEPTEADRTREAVLAAHHDVKVAQALFEAAVDRRAAVLTVANRAGMTWKELGSLLISELGGTVTAQRAKQLGTDRATLNGRRSSKKERAVAG